MSNLTLDAADWSEFERTVGTLLSLSGFEVTPEKILSSKKVDLVARKREFGKSRIYAVECKDLGRRLSKDVLLHIETEYHQLYDHGDLDFLLLVTRHGLAPAAQTRVDHSRFLLHQTIDDLRLTLIDFRHYLRDIKHQYEDEEGLHRYYVPLRASSDGQSDDLEDTVARWLVAPDRHPLAILAGYGAGKSTFMRHLAHKFACEFTDTSAARIPILIPLSELCREQTLEGLLGRHFTSLHQVPGYSFPLFDEMNRLGCFLILLDGFDEMKHSMTSAEFRYTFRELLRLVNHQSKVILTGRPTAFLTDTERKEFLHAYIKFRDKIVARSQTPRFDEITIDPFDERQIRAFVNRFRQYLETSPDAEPTRRIPEPDEFFQSATLIEIARRPIQLRMLFDVLPYYHGSLDDLTVREVYTFFVEQLIERESQKLARRRFSARTRRVFHEELAFYMWIESASTVELEGLPMSLLPELNEGEDSRDAMRDLISGSLLEVRYPGKLFFPHRSIQEYLVSEFVLSCFRGEKYASDFARTVDTQIDFVFVNERLSPEILDFMISASGVDDRKRAIPFLHQGGKALPRTTLRYWLDCEKTLRALVPSCRDGDTWSLALLCLDQTMQVKQEVHEAALACISNSNPRDRRHFYEAVFLTWLLFSMLRDTQLLEQMVLQILKFTETRTRQTSRGDICGRLRPGFVAAIVESITDRESSELRLAGMRHLLERECAGKIGLSDWYEDGSGRPSFAWSLHFIDRITCTSEMQGLLQEKFDAELLATRKRSH